MEIIYAGDKVVGQIEEGVFIKWVVGRLHRLRKPPAWAIDARAFDDHIRGGCHTIQILDKEGLEYSVSVETFIRHMGTLNRNFGKQYYLTLPYWQSKARVQGSLL